MKPVARIRTNSIKRKRQKGDGPVTYRQRTKYLQIHAELTAWKASQVLDGGAAEARLRGEANG